MRLIVFGATGRTGRRLVGHALDEGHEVRAAVRSPEKLGVEGEGLEVVQADLRDADAVESAVRGGDVVVNVAGQTDDSGGDILTVAARHITGAMGRSGVDRLIAVAGAGLSHPKDQRRSLSGKLIMAVMKRVAAGVLEDAEEYGRIIRGSDLRWTIVRPPRLKEGPGDGDYEAGYLQLGFGHTIERGDLARFILECAEGDLWVREAPMVTG